MRAAGTTSHQGSGPAWILRKRQAGRACANEQKWRAQSSNHVLARTRKRCNYGYSMPRASAGARTGRPMATGHRKMKRAAPPAQLA
eukprot:scaffold82_cov105-Isochrysis_galbana.AAC.1